MNFIPLNRLTFPKDAKYSRTNPILVFELSHSNTPEIFSEYYLILLFEYLSIQDVLRLSQINQHCYQIITSIIFPWTLQIPTLASFLTFTAQFTNPELFSNESWIGLTVLEIPDFEISQDDLQPLLERVRHLQILNLKVSEQWNEDRETSQEIFNRLNEIHAKNVNVSGPGKTVWNYNSQYKGKLHVDGMRQNELIVIILVLLFSTVVAGYIVGIWQLTEYMLNKYPGNNMLIGFLFTPAIIIIFGVVVLFICASIACLVIYCFSFVRTTRKNRQCETDRLLV